MSASAVAAVGIGAALGAWLRWGLGSALNPVFPTLPLGTLAANLVGGYLIGLAIAFFAENAACRRRCACSSSPAFSAG